MLGALALPCMTECVMPGVMASKDYFSSSFTVRHFYLKFKGIMEKRNFRWANSRNIPHSQQQQKAGKGWGERPQTERSNRLYWSLERSFLSDGDTEAGGNIFFYSLTNWCSFCIMMTWPSSKKSSRTNSTACNALSGSATRKFFAFMIFQSWLGWYPSYKWVA